MSHEHHSSHLTPGFGKNTNGLGIFIIAVIFVVITIFVLHLWGEGTKEYDHYRIEKPASSDHGPEKAH